MVRGEKQVKYKTKEGNGGETGEEVMNGVLKKTQKGKRDSRNS